MEKLLLHIYKFIPFSLLIMSGFLDLTFVNAQTDMIIDHKYARLDVLKDVPSEWIDSTKNNLHIRYEHTSHGSQITTGMTNLDAFMGGNGVYIFANNGGQGILDFHDIYSSDLSSGEDTWQQKTRDYLDDPSNQDCNVVMWSWCQILGHDGDEDPGYCSKMETLIAEYGPDGTKIQSGDRTVPVQFIFMTGHVNGQGEEGETNQINNYIRDHCLTNNRILFDFADIESYDPDDNYFLDDFCRDDCSYNDQGTADGNWATEWVADKIEMTSVDDISHNEPNGGHWYQCGAAHTHPLNANMKAYAAWYMFARMAGWQSTSVVLVDSIDIYPEGGSGIIDTDEGTLQLYANVFPDTATNQTISWSVLSGSGSASIDENGLLTAIENGTVSAVALAQDGSDVSDTLEIIITNQITEVESLTLSFSGGNDTIVSGDSIRVIIEILPVDADSQNVELSIVPVTGTATIGSNNYVIGGDTGIVRIIGIATDGFGASDTLHIYITHQPVLVEYIEISTESGDSVIHELGGTLHLIASVYPQDTDNKEVIWEIINVTGQARLLEGAIIEGVSNGSFIVIAYASDTSGVSNTRIFYVETLSVSHGIISTSKLILYPNPAREYIILKGDINFPLSLFIYDLKGNLFLYDKIENNNKVIDISILSPGLYTVKLISKQIISVCRFIKN